MKLKRAAGAAAVFASVMMMNTAVQAAVYTIEKVSGSAGDEVTVKVSVAPNAATATAMNLNGYSMNIAYDSTVLTPVLSTAKKDAAGEKGLFQMHGLSLLRTAGADETKIRLCWFHQRKPPCLKPTVIILPLFALQALTL